MIASLVISGFWLKVILPSGDIWKCLEMFRLLHGVARSDTTGQLHFHFSLSCNGEGNGNPLQCSCLENPRDGGAWWAAVYGVAQSWTRLKWLSSSSSSSSSRDVQGLLPRSVPTSIHWVEVRDAAKCPTVPRTAPQQNSVSPDMSEWESQCDYFSWH